MTLSTFSQDYAFLRLEVVSAASIVFNIKTRVECCAVFVLGKGKMQVTNSSSSLLDMY
jgi:hypothetical protein